MAIYGIFYLYTVEAFEKKFPAVKTFSGLFLKLRLRRF